MVPSPQRTPSEPTSLPATGDPLGRRSFLKGAAGAAAAVAASRAALAASPPGQGIPTRPLGKTGVQVSIIGIGGFHIGTLPEKDSVALMHEAIDEGITFFDNSWDYHMGGSETLMGKALAEGGRRDKVFLMTKVCARDYDGCRQQLDESLRRLKTDRIDLWQFHEVNYKEDPEWLFDRGPVKAAIEARKAGKVRFIGFTGHKDIDIHLAVLAKPFDWDAVQMPINIMDAHYRSFQKEVVPQCNRRGIGVVGMKALAGGFIPREAGVDAVLCRRYALSLPISTLVCGIGSRDNLRQDVAVARNFQPLPKTEVDALLANTREAGKQGLHEPFKTTMRFDAGYHRKQHGL